MRVQVVALSLLSMAVPAFADQIEDAKACSSVADSLQRLTCFDQAFPSTPATTAESSSPQSASAPSGVKWEVSEEKSPLDDSATVKAFLAPTTVSGTGVGNAEMFLMVRCQENTTAVVIATSMFMTGDTAKVTTRLGDEAAQTSQWNISSNYKSVGLWSGAKAIPFIKDLAKSSNLVVRVESRDRTDAQFDLGDIRAVAEKVSAACKWKLD